MNRFIDCPANA